MIQAVDRCRTFNLVPDPGSLKDNAAAWVTILSDGRNWAAILDKISLPQSVLDPDLGDS